MPDPWITPEDWIRVTTLDVHTGGEPLRIVTGGFPPIPGTTILDKRRFVLEHLDHLRTALMWEPRGHADMYGALLTEPERGDSDAGVLFLHNEGLSTMCGHGILGLAMAGVEGGVLEPRREAGGGDGVLTLDTPAGQVVAFTHWEADRDPGEGDDPRILSASFRNVPSFVAATGQEISVEGLGTVQYDLAFGGAFYAFCDADALDLDLLPEGAPKLVDLGRRIKAAISHGVPIQHPTEPELGFLYGVIFVGGAHDPRNHSRNVCIFAEGEVDRSPTGTGVSARAALHMARGDLSEGESFTVESILGTTFTGRVVGKAQVGGLEAVVPEVWGTSFITGRSEFLLDPNDPLQHGFFLR